MLEAENINSESIEVLKNFKKFKELLETKKAHSPKEKRKLANQFMIDLSGTIEGAIKTVNNYVQNIYDGYDIPIKLYHVSETSRIILFVHGGGNIQGNFDTHDYLCQKIAILLNIDVVAIEYRLSPEYRFPISLTDILSVYQFFTNQRYEVYLTGDSAGGNLVAVLNIIIRKKCFKKASGQILMYPLLDNDFRTLSYQKFGNLEILRPEDVKYVTSIYTGYDYNDIFVNNKLIYPALEQDLTVFPRTFMISAECDILLDSQIVFCKRLKDAGIDCKQEIAAGSVHGFMQYGKFFDNIITKILQKISLWLIN